MQSLLPSLRQLDEHTVLTNAPRRALAEHRAVLIVVFRSAKIRCIAAFAKRKTTPICSAMLSKLLIDSLNPGLATEQVATQKVNTGPVLLSEASVTAIAIANLSYASKVLLAITAFDIAADNEEVLIILNGKAFEALLVNVPTVRW